MRIEHWQAFDWLTIALSVAAVLLLGLLVRLRQRHRQVQLDNARQYDRLEWLQAELDVSQDAAVLRQSELTAAQVERARLQTLLEAEQSSNRTRETQLMQLKHEFAALSEQTLRQQTDVQSEQLGALLSPLTSQLGEFRSRIDQLHHHSATERASLQAEVANLKQASERMGRETLSLTQALKGDQSVKGNWGEVVLESLLQRAGLRPGIEFLVQPSCTTDTGQLRRPDVIVRLPGERDVVIDAKVSLGDYRLGTETGDRQHLKRHATKLRNHARTLAERNYDRLEAVRSLDLVLMFVPLDAALAAALEAMPDLLDEALSKRVAIVSPNSLMLLLRMIQSLWQQQSQQDNAHLIANQAASLHDQFAHILADLDVVCRQLAAAERAACGLRSRLGQGQDSVLRRLDRLKDLGVPIRKPLAAASEATRD
ncbi:MAG: DNA recombination protein RmuC [Pseudomonadales bacterium]